MKKIVFVLVISLITIAANAQLANSKWKTTLQINQPVNTIFSFSSDTLVVINSDDNSAIETMKYSTQDTVLTIQKIYGQSDCDTSGAGKYSYKIDGNTLSLKLISDYCTDRSDVIGNIKLEKTE